MGLLCGDVHEMLIRKNIVNRGVLALNNEPRDMIGDNILYPHLGFDL